MSSSKRFLVVDAWVIATASKRSSDDEVWKAADILCKILYVCHKIVLDYGESIIEEYERQAKSELVKQWFITMQTRGDKIVFRPRSPATLSVLTDPADQKYFQVVVNSPHKIIVSEDSHFTSIANHSEVASKGISIWNLDTALANL